jgi:hypothetical protein
MLEVLVFYVLISLHSIDGLILGDECYIVYLILELRSLSMTIVKREIYGLINILNSPRKEESFIDIISKSFEEGLGEIYFGFTFAIWA